MLMLLLQTTETPPTLAPALSAGGWVFMIASNLFVWGFAFWCFARVLREPVVEPPDPVKDFHSA